MSFVEGPLRHTLEDLLDNALLLAWFPNQEAPLCGQDVLQAVW